MSGAEHAPARLDYADGMRSVAVFVVVCLHAAAPLVMRHGELGDTAWWSANLIDAAARWAVPVFFMLSGALILDPWRRDPLAVFYRKRLGRIGIPLLFWSAFYFFWYATYHGRNVTLEAMAREVGSGLSANHLYFLVVLLGLYAVAPALRVLLARLGSPRRWILVALLVALPASGAEATLPRNALTLWIPYLGYFALGLLLRDMAMTRARMRLGWVALAASTALVAIGTGVLFSRWGAADPRAQTLYDYLHPLVVVQAIAAFLVLRECLSGRSGAAARWLANLGSAALGIYLVHPAVLDVLRGWDAAWVSAVPLVGVPLEAAAAFALSAAATHGLLRVPHLRRIVG